jgi:hypothetical protein
MKAKDTIVLAQALTETMASIKPGTSSGSQYAVILDGKRDSVDEWALRTFISKTWTRIKGEFNERYMSPCGNFRSLVIDSGAVRITSWPPTPGASQFVMRSGRCGSSTGQWEADC